MVERNEQERNEEDMFEPKKEAQILSRRNVLGGAMAAFGVGGLEVADHYRARLNAGRERELTAEASKDANDLRVAVEAGDVKATVAVVRKLLGRNKEELNKVLDDLSPPEQARSR